MYDQFHDVPQQVSIEPLWRIELGTGVLQADFLSRKYRSISWQPLKRKYQKSARWNIVKMAAILHISHTQFKCQMLNVIVLGTFVYL